MKQKSGFVPFLSVKEEISYAVNRVGGFEVKCPHRGRLGYRKVVTNFFMSRCVCVKVKKCRGGQATPTAAPL